MVLGDVMFFYCGLVGVVLGDVIFPEPPEPDPGEKYFSLRWHWLVPAAPTLFRVRIRYGFSGKGFTYLAVSDFGAATPEPAVPSPVQGVVSEGVQEAPAHSIYAGG